MYNYHVPNIFDIIFEYSSININVYLANRKKSLQMAEVFKETSIIFYFT